MGKLTQDEKDAIREAGVAKWWDEWFTADYSWEGLTKFPWEGWKVVTSKTAYNKYFKAHGLPDGCPNKACQVVPADFDGLPEGTKTRPATLQDYWRDQEGKLQGPESGKQYTLAHLPEKYPDGTETWKADLNHENWKTLSALITERLECGTKTNVKFFYRGESVTGTDGRSNFQGCVLPALPPQISQTTSTRQDSKRNTESSDDQLALHLTLHQAAVLQAQNFTGTIFGSPTSFHRTLFFGGDADFRNAQFSDGNADFRNAQFSGGYANFGNARFSGGYANFRNAQFSGGKADFREAQFSGGFADFIEAQFSGGYANFGNARFSGGYANFGNARFSGGYANFGNARFSGGYADFHKAQFSGGKADFREAQFSGGFADFNETEFKVSFTFASARFEKRALFKDTIFPPPAGSQNAFSTSEFLGLVDFSRKATSDKFFPYNAFANATIKDEIILPDHGPDKAQESFDLVLKSLKEHCAEKNDEETGAQFIALEQGCIRLKRAMENASDKTRAQRFFKFELLARQHRPSTSDTVKLFTKLYGWTADYGGSIWLPLLRLAQTFAFFAFIYGVTAYFAGVAPKSILGYVWGPLEFSATHIFRPLSIWSSATPSPDVSWVGKYRAQLYGGEWFAIKILATIQSFLSITLLFLFGLATKRKFQIS